MDLDIKQKARFAFLPRLIEIAKGGRETLVDMISIGRSLGFTSDLTEKIELYLISENLISPSQFGGIISIEGIGKVAWSSLPRLVTENRVQTIFTVFEGNLELQLEIKCWAENHGCQITVEENIPDIVAIPHFVSVIDRAFLGKEAWELYLEYREVDDEPDNDPLFKACIIVDSIRDIKLPDFDPVFCFDLREKHSIQLIINSIEIAKQIVDG